MNRLVYPAFVTLGVIWGSNFIFMKWAADLITPMQIALLRVLFGFLPLVLVAAIRGVFKFEHLRLAHHFFVMSLLATAIYYSAFAAGTALLPSGIAGMLSGSIPLFSFLCAFLFLREEPINGYTVSGVTLGFAGVLLIAQPWNSVGGGVDVKGVLYMIGGSFSVGCSFVYARRFLSNRQIPALALSTYQIGFALMVLFLVTDLDGITAIGDDVVSLTGLVLGLGLLGTGVAYMLYYFLVEQLGALKAAASTYIPPVVALVIGAVFVNEPIGVLEWVAVVLILGGVYLLQTGRRLPSN